MKRGGLVLLAVVALLGAALGALFMFRADVATALFQRMAPQGVGNVLTARLPNGLHAVLCGTGSPMPDRRRAGPCTAVIAGERVFVFDAGEGAAETLSLMGVSPGRIETVFLTHLHSDHIDGLAPMALQHWGNVSAQAPLQLVGPTGTARVAAGLNEAYAIDSTYRVAHHGEQIMPPSGFGLAAREFVIADGADSVVVHDADGVRIIAFQVNHAPVDGAVGYRIEYAGRSIVISGDTSRDDRVIAAARGADLLVHEAIDTHLNQIMQNAANAGGRGNVGQIFNDILTYHTSTEDAGRVAQEAGVGALALTHLLPPTPLPGLDQRFVRAARTTFDGPVWAARDGDVISLPASGGIEHSHQLRF
jgi:ribonuclease Z